MAMVKALFISAWIITLLVLIGERMIRKKWEVTYKKGSRYYDHRTTLHFWVEGLLLLAFIYSLSSRNEFLYGNQRIFYTIPIYFLIIAALRAFVEWKVAHAENAWRCELLAVAGYAVFLGVVAILHTIYF